ncbi:MAG: hypothetical protein PHF67_00480 [Candidatus Nanoarchaeia archaeon]|nr:hypothetical protein [Candidatus Nanoarchaeia archaeon]
MVVEVFNRIGEEELHSDSNFYKRYKKEDDELETNDKTESNSKPLSEAKKEFFEHLKNDSLTIDACDRLNHDWKKN